MIKRITGYIALAFFSNIVNAVTLTSEFTITNRVIEKENIVSTEPAMTYTNDGSGFYKITDSHTDAQFTNLNSPRKSSFWGYGRATSLVTIQMKGKRLGHTFNVYGKIGNSSIQLSGSIPLDANGNVGLLNGIRGSCDSVEDNGPAENVIHKINVNSSISSDGGNCITNEYNYGSSSSVIRSTGVERDFYLRLDLLQQDISYRKAPPDVYVGNQSFTGIFISAGNPQGSIKTNIPYINNLTIIKKPYFDNVTLLSQDNTFTVQTVGSKVNGSVTVPYVMNGQFTPYDRVTLNVTSVNNFSLINSLDTTKKIPYSLSTTLGTRKFQLATQGVGGGTVVFTDLPKSASAMQGRFDASFSVDKTSVVSGEYTDTLTAVYQIDLES